MPPGLYQEVDDLVHGKDVAHDSQCVGSSMFRHADFVEALTDGLQSVAVNGVSPLLMLTRPSRNRPAGQISRADTSSVRVHTRYLSPVPGVGHDEASHDQRIECAEYGAFCDHASTCGIRWVAGRSERGASSGRFVRDDRRCALPTRG